MNEWSIYFIAAIHQAMARTQKCMTCHIKSEDTVKNSISRFQVKCNKQFFFFNVNLIPKLFLSDDIAVDMGIWIIVPKKVILTIVNCQFWEFNLSIEDGILAIKS